MHILLYLSVQPKISWRLTYLSLSAISLDSSVVTMDLHSFREKFTQLSRKLSNVKANVGSEGEVQILKIIEELNALEYKVKFLTEAVSNVLSPFIYILFMHNCIVFSRLFNVFAGCFSCTSKMLLSSADQQRCVAPAALCVDIQFTLQTTGTAKTKLIKRGIMFKHLRRHS